MDADGESVRRIIIRSRQSAASSFLDAEDHPPGHMILRLSEESGLADANDETALEEGVLDLNFDSDGGISLRDAELHLNSIEYEIAAALPETLFHVNITIFDFERGTAPSQSHTVSIAILVEPPRPAKRCITYHRMMEECVKERGHWAWTCDRTMAREPIC